MNKNLVAKAKTLLGEEKSRLEAELSKFSHRNTKTTEENFQTNFPNNGDSEDENASEVAQFSDNLKKRFAMLNRHSNKSRWVITVRVNTVINRLTSADCLHARLQAPVFNVRKP